MCIWIPLDQSFQVKRAWLEMASDNPLLQVGSGSNEKGNGSGGQKINGHDRIRILIPGLMKDREIERDFYFLKVHLASRENLE